MLNWASRFNIFILLDSHSYHSPHGIHDWIFAADALRVCSSSANKFNDLKLFLAEQNDWTFGHVAYDAKNIFHPLRSEHPDMLGYPDFFFFQPAHIISCSGDIIEISSATYQPDRLFREISALPEMNHLPNEGVQDIQPRMTKEEYIATIGELRHHILRGNCYEVNYCQEFFAADLVIDPLQVYQHLTALSPTPFSGYYRLEDKYLICASPERFLQRQGSRIISQPIKGTMQRNTEDPAADDILKAALLKSQKEQSENVMVVDIVRNDLSRICREGSVHVEELYGIYTFPQVHQMISTIAGELEGNISFPEILQATFPMASMTGAPKLRVMELIEQYERSRRGIFSGTIGYISPTGDFDFNVVIRSIMYNATNRYLSYQVGGGITWYSDPEKEYEECLLKASAIKKVLKNQHLQ